MKPRITVVGVVGGVLTGLGVLTYLQQSGSVYPTQIVTGLAVLLGAVWGVALPTATRGLRRR